MGDVTVTTSTSYIQSMVIQQYIALGLLIFASVSHHKLPVIPDQVRLSRFNRLVSQSLHAVMVHAFYDIIRLDVFQNGRRVRSLRSLSGRGLIRNVNDNSSIRSITQRAVSVVKLGERRQNNSHDRLVHRPHEASYTEPVVYDILQRIKGQIVMPNANFRLLDEASFRSVLCSLILGLFRKYQHATNSQSLPMSSSIMHHHESNITLPH